MRRGAPLLLALVWRPSWCCGPSRRRSSGSARLSDRRTEAHRALTSVTPARAASDLALPQLLEGEMSRMVLRVARAHDAICASGGWLAVTE